MNEVQKKILAWLIATGLGVNAYFIRGLVTRVDSTYENSIKDQSTIQQISKEMSEVKEAVRGFQDLRIDVAILKHDVADLKSDTAKQQGRKNGS